MKKLVREKLYESSESDDTTSHLNDLFSDYNIEAIKDFDKDGTEDLENVKTYTQYSFRGDDSVELLSLEVLEDFDGEKSFQFWYDASPIITGNPQTLDPDYQPYKDIENYIEEVMEYNEWKKNRNEKFS